jgi:hypothetical protein
MATLPEIDQTIVMNDPEQFKNLYLGVKQSMIEAYTKSQEETKQPTPQPTVKTKQNLNEVAITKSGGSQRGGESELL